MEKVFFGAFVGNSILILILLASASTGFLQYRFIDVNSELSAEQENVLINGEVVEELNEMYSNTDHEISMCIEIKQINKFSSDKESVEITYLITGVNNVQTSGLDYSISGFCEYGLIHSHPKNTPYFSLADINVFRKGVKKGEIISVLMYGENQFSFITRNNFEEQKLKIFQS